ncbi:hypothetical protein ACFV4Q_24150 [Streptomyces nojiriensis]|uniref:hypothetical protein n=1 Tax=Streptomyces nojiriensis TaxID=66374 RepID=UPI0036692A85
MNDVQWLDPPAPRFSATPHGGWRMAGFAAGMLCAAREGTKSFFDHSGLPIHDVRPSAKPTPTTCWSGPFRARPPEYGGV